MKDGVRQSLDFVDGNCVRRTVTKAITSAVMRTKRTWKKQLGLPRAYMAGTVNVPCEEMYVSTMVVKDYPRPCGFHKQFDRA